MVNVSWFDATAYRELGGSEAADGGGSGRRPRAASTADVSPGAATAPLSITPTSRGRVGHTTDVSAHPKGASPFGILDLAGNAWEWCDELDDPTFYARGPARNPRAGPVMIETRAVVRGGAWMFDAGAR